MIKILNENIYAKLSTKELKQTIEELKIKLEFALLVWQERLNNGKSRQDYKKGINYEKK